MSDQRYTAHDMTHDANSETIDPNARTDPRTLDGHESWCEMCALLHCSTSIAPARPLDPPENVVRLNPHSSAPVDGGSRTSVTVTPKTATTVVRGVRCDE